MATGEAAVESEGSELKYLAFVRALALLAVAWARYLYCAARARLGALQTLITRVEAAVTALVGPVCTKFVGVPDEVLQFLDNKIDAATKKYDKYAPSFVKRVLNTAKNAAKPAIKSLQVAWVNGPRAAIRYIVGEVYQTIQSLFAKFRQFLHALLGKRGQCLMYNLEATIHAAIKTPEVHYTLISLIPTAVDLLGKSGQGITSVLGTIASVMDKSSAALSRVPVVCRATKAAASAASAAQTTLAGVVEKSTAALTALQSAGEEAKADAPAGSANSSLTEETVS